MKTKTIKYYMKLPYTIIMIPDDEGYYVKIKELPGCMSQGDNESEALSNIQEAKELWLETAISRNISIPEPESDETYSGKFIVRLPKSLHAKIARRAKEENTSINQLVVSMLSNRSGEYDMMKKFEKCIDKVEKQKDLEHQLISNGYLQTSIPEKGNYNIPPEEYNLQGAVNERSKN